VVGQAALFTIDEILSDLSAKGDDLERKNVIVDFELFRPDLEHAVPRSAWSRVGARPMTH
jgi:transposase, IS5 family